MKRLPIFILLFLVFSTGMAQEPQSLKLTGEEIESLFISNNLELIAAKFDIDIADAAIAQAKLRTNPELSVGSINLWSSKSQREGAAEVISPLFGSFAKNTEFSIELSQLIQTAGKRKKLVRREETAKNIALLEFEEMLRALKTELRKSVYEIGYSQAYLEILNNQHQSLSRLIESYKKQVQQGNIARNVLLRLQSLLFELENEINETLSELIEQEKVLKILLHLPPQTDIEIINSLTTGKDPETISLSGLLETAAETRPDLKIYKLQNRLTEKTLAYEKSLSVPDISVSAVYDRYGGVWKNFIGFGINIELPMLNRNQGNIRAAQMSRDQSIYRAQQHQNVIEQEITVSYKNYTNAYLFYQKIHNDSLLPELDNVLEAYTKNLINKNISMIEYIDFLDAYKTNKQTMLNARKKMDLQFEELQYFIGTDIN